MIDILKTFIVLDLLRLAGGIILFTTSLFFPMNDMPWQVAFIFLAYPAIWIILKLLDIADESRYPALPYVPCTADMIAFTYLFYLTGTLNSIFIMLFFFSVIMSSLNVTIRTGRYAMVFSMIAVTGLSGSVYLGLLPGFNILGGNSSITLAQLAGTLITFFPLIILVQGLVFGLTNRIQGTANELYTEKEALRAQNELMDRELEIARNIQRHLLPSKAPWSHVHSLYCPMRMVGGDFFDYLAIGEGRIGIFISDVSGHGVAAALITSMIKTAISQAGAASRDPGEMMRYLNSTLYSQTKENFVTAFYGIYDPATREIVYANAGHNPPLVIHDGSVKELVCPRSIPLAIGDDGYLAVTGKTFHADSAVLEKGCKLLLFTDGLTEASSPRDRTMMFEDSLEKHLLEIAALPGDEFINMLFARLVEFQGSEQFEDDVCFICLDIP